MTNDEYPYTLNKITQNVDEGGAHVDILFRLLAFEIIIVNKLIFHVTASIVTVPAMAVAMLMQ